MSAESTAPSAEVLRKLGASIALDVAHAPLKSKYHQRLTNLTADFLALEKAMMTTSDMVNRSIARAEELVQEATNWQSISEERGLLASVMDQSMTRVAGTDNGAAQVSQDHAHP